MGDSVSLTKEETEHRTARTNRLTAALGVATAVLVLATTALGFFSNQQVEQKQDAQSQASDLTGTVTTLEQQVGTLEGQKTELQNKNGELEAQVVALQKQLQDAGTEPTAPPTTPGPTTSLPGEVHLADNSTRPDGLLVIRDMNTSPDTTINGKSYDFSWKRDLGFRTSPLLAISIDTNRSYSTFTARVGLAGTSRGKKGKIEILADEKVLFSEPVEIGKSFDPELDITGVQRLEIKLYGVSGDYATYAIGDPVIS